MRSGMAQLTPMVNGSGHGAGGKGYSQDALSARGAVYVGGVTLPVGRNDARRQAGAANLSR